MVFPASTRAEPGQEISRERQRIELDDPHQYHAIHRATGSDDCEQKRERNSRIKESTRIESEARHSLTQRITNHDQANEHEGNSVREAVVKPGEETANRTLHRQVVNCAQSRIDG